MYAEKRPIVLVLYKSENDAAGKTNPRPDGPDGGSRGSLMAGDEGFAGRPHGRPPFASGLAALARSAGGRSRAAFAPRPERGSNPREAAQKRSDPVAGAASVQMVGDEGFEPPALCV